MALLLTVGEAAAELRISRAKFYQLLANGDIESVQIGGSRRIPVDVLTKYVESLRSAS